MQRLVYLLSTILFVAVCAQAQTVPALKSTPAVSPTPSPAASPSASPAPSASASPETVKTAKAAKAEAKSKEQVAKAASSSRAAIVLPPEKLNPLRVPRFEQPPTIDGKLDDGVWKQAALLKDFYQIQPGDNIAPSRRTEVMIGYDSRFLYVAYHAYDEPDKVRANVAKRDQIFDDDYVGLFFDTFNDSRKAYEMNFNPLGIQADGILTEGQGEDFSVDMVVDSKGILTSDGFTVEVAIPFKSLRYEAGKDKLWGVHFYRRIKRFNNELDMWMPISRDESSWLTQAGHITGLEGISTERTIELIPSLTLSETGKRVASIPPGVLNNSRGLVDDGRFVNEPVHFDPGLTAKFGITPTVTLDLALNPDFAQVEADQTVITANQRFPIFFEEKRPFFLEGIDIFRTQLTAVHTRAIVDPDVAVKLTGKRGKNTFGLLLASDNAPGNFTGDERLDPINQRFIDKNAYIGVLRLKHDVGRDSNIGFLATSYNFIEKRNQVAGFDGRFRINKTTTLDLQALASTSRGCFFNSDSDAVAMTSASPCYDGSSSTNTFYRTGNGLAYAFDLNDNGRNWGYEFYGNGRTKDFRSDVGFNRRTNTNNVNLFMRYNSNPNPKAKIIQWRVFTSPQVNFDWQGRLQGAYSNSQFRLTLPKQGYFGIGLLFGYERLFEEEFGLRRSATRQGAFAGQDNERSAYNKGFYVYTGTTPSKKYSVYMLAEHDTGIFDFDFGGGSKFPRVSPGALLDPDAPLDPGAGNFWHIEGTFTYQPTSALRNSLDFTKERLVRRDTGRVAYDDNIIALKSTYQFTRFTFARARIDYDTLASSVRGQFLLGYTPNPGTAFYVGYNDDLNRNGFNPISGQLEPGLRRNGRTFFIKMSYLFRKSFGS